MEWMVESKGTVNAHSCGYTVHIAQSRLNYLVHLWAGISLQKLKSVGVANVLHI